MPPSNACHPHTYLRHFFLSPVLPNERRLRPRFRHGRFMTVLGHPTFPPPTYGSDTYHYTLLLHFPAFTADSVYSHHGLPTWQVRIVRVGDVAATFITRTLACMGRVPF